MTGCLLGACLCAGGPPLTSSTLLLPTILTLPYCTYPRTRIPTSADSGSRGGGRGTTGCPLGGSMCAGGPAGPAGPADGSGRLGGGGGGGGLLSSSLRCRSCRQHLHSESLISIAWAAPCPQTAELQRNAGQMSPTRCLALRLDLTAQDSTARLGKQLTCSAMPSSSA